MTSFLEGHPSQIASATGISYEVPLITAVTNLRKVIAHSDRADSAWSCARLNAASCTDRRNWPGASR